MGTVDLLAPRVVGLIPLWLVPLVALLWAGAIALAAGPLRGRWPGLAGELGAVGGLTAAHLLFFWRPLLTPAHVPRGGGDLNSFFFPLHAFAAAQVRQGDLPLWNPHLHAGMPHLANFQSALLYPPNLVAYLLASPFRYGTLELLAIMHYLVASLGAYALGRSLGMGRVPAVASGIIFAYSGFLVAHLGHYSMLCVAVWLPVLLLALRLTVLRASWLWALGGGLVIFLMTNAGHQQTLLYALTAGGAWWVFWLISREGWLRAAPAPIRGGSGTLVSIERESSTGRRLAPLLGDLVRGGGAVAFGLGLAAPMVVPSLELARRSVRSGLSYEEATAFSVQPVALLQFILPKAFGSNPTDYWGPFSNGEIWAYAGVATLVLAGVALAARPGSLRIFLAGIGVVALLYALGPATPLHGWTYRFGPLYDLIRAPARAYLYVDLALALLAGLGIQELATRHPLQFERLDFVLRQTLRGLLVTLAALLLLVLPLFYSLILGVNDPSNRPVIAVDGLNLLVLYLAGTAALLWSVSRGHVRGATAGIAAITLITLDLFGATATFNPTPEDLVTGFRHPEAVTFLRERAEVGEQFRIESATLIWQPNLAAVASLDDIGGLFDPMQPAIYPSVRDAAVADRPLPLYDMLGARYLITDHEAGQPGPAFSPVLRTPDGLTIWENREALPRAWLADAARHVDRATALAASRQPAFDPRAELYLTGNLPPAEPGATGAVRITRYAPDEVRLQVETDRAAYLVLADTAYPGWTATIDGEATPVAIADGLFRAVTVPAGTHEVVFRFQPRFIAASVAVAGASGLWGLVMLGLGLRRRRP